MPAVKNVGEPCAGKPLARIDAAAGGNQRQSGSHSRAAWAPPADPTGSFPARGMVAQWLKAGVVEKGRFSPTEDGVPQGGVISPVLLNVALHGISTFVISGGGLG
jgi:hypothetical protein